MRGQILLYPVEGAGVQGLIQPAVVLVRGSVRVFGVTLATQVPGNPLGLQNADP